MRRFRFWFAPLLIAVAATALFGWGLYAFVTGNLGTPVGPVSRNASVAAPRSTIVPAILGDSLAHGAGDERGLGISGRLDQELRRRKIPARRTLNLGVNGARTYDLQRQLGAANVRTLLGQSNVIVLSIGGTDLWGAGSWRTAPPPDPEYAMDDVLGRVEAIVKDVRVAAPQARIFYVGLYNPFRSAPDGAALSTLVNRWNAKVVERFAQDHNFAVVQTSDLFAWKDRLSVDRFHPGGEGYGLIATRIAEDL